MTVIAQIRVRAAERARYVVTYGLYFGDGEIRETSRRCALGELDAVVARAQEELVAKVDRLNLVIRWRRRRVSGFASGSVLAFSIAAIDEEGKRRTVTAATQTVLLALRLAELALAEELGGSWTSVEAAVNGPVLERGEEGPGPAEAAAASA